MHALLFEMEPREGHETHYFNRAQALRPLLAKHEGLLFIERFKSLSRPGVILSHSHWRDEAALAKWRSDATHYNAQAAGRNKHFKNYRLRISHVLKMLRQNGDTQSWSTEGAYADVRTTAPRYLTIVASKTEPAVIGGETFLSVNEDENYISIADATSYDHGESIIAKAKESPHATFAMIALTSRDYGMFERSEAPQFFPAAKVEDGDIGDANLEP